MRLLIKQYIEHHQNNYKFMGNTRGMQQRERIRLERIQQIAEQQYLDQQLNLNGQDQYWPDILQLRDWSILKTLQLFKCNINDTNIKKVLDLSWPFLASINLNSNHITHIGIQQIVVKQWPRLDSITLNNNSIQNEGFRQIIHNLSNKLVCLSVINCGITAKGMQPILSNQPHHLKSLKLNNNNIGSYGVKYLTKIDLSNLQHLSVGDCRIGEEGFKHMVKGKYPNLRHLDWKSYENENRVQNNSWQILCNTEWKKLTQFRFKQNESISLMGFLFLANLAIIWQYDVQVQNRSLLNSIVSMLSHKFQVKA